MNTGKRLLLVGVVIGVVVSLGGLLWVTAKPNADEMMQYRPGVSFPYIVSSERRLEIASRYGKVSEGITSREVEALLGEPDIVQLGFVKRGLQWKPNGRRNYVYLICQNNKEYNLSGSFVVIAIDEHSKVASKWSVGVPGRE